VVSVPPPIPGSCLEYYINYTSYVSHDLVKLL
jgi:hypothetical protein